jgi:hypothetical protein
MITVAKGRKTSGSRNSGSRGGGGFKNTDGTFTKYARMCYSRIYTGMEELKSFPVKLETTQEWKS